jgi:biotin carboxylase
MTSFSSPATSTPRSAAVDRPARTGGVLLLYSLLNEPRRPALRRVAELHGRVVLLRERPADVPDWARPCVDEVLPVRRADLPGAVRAVRDLLNRTGSTVDGVVSLSETGVFFCAQLARALGLPAADPELLVQARDKAVMRRLFAAAGLPTVRFGTAATLAEATAIAADIGYPVVLKPLLAGGSLYVGAVGGPAELAAVFGTCLRGGVDVVAGDPLVDRSFAGGAAPRLLVEQRIDGDRLFPSTLDLPVGEVSVEGCVAGGRVHVLARHDKPLPANGPFFEEVLWSAPSRLDPAYLARVDAVAAGAVAAVGLDNCMFHVEMRTTPAGPVLLEVAGRMGGGPIFRSAAESTGVDLIEVMLRLAQRRELPPALLRPSRAVPVVTFGIFAPAGWLHAIEGLDEVRAHPGVLEVAVYERPGSYIARAPHSEHCTVHVLTTAPTHEAAEAVGTWAQRTLRFVMGDPPAGAGAPAGADAPAGPAGGQ